MATTSYPKDKIKILLMENIHQVAVDDLRKDGFTVETAEALPHDELIEKIKTVHAIGIRSKTPLSKEVLENANKLLCIGCFCIGTDRVDLPYAASKGIPVFNAPFSNTRSVGARRARLAHSPCAPPECSAHQPPGCGRRARTRCGAQLNS